MKKPLIIVLLLSLLLLISCEDFFDDDDDDNSGGSSSSSSNPLIYDAIAVGDPADTVEKASFTVGETIYIKFTGKHDGKDIKVAEITIFNSIYQIVERRTVSLQKQTSKEQSFYFSYTPTSANTYDFDFNVTTGSGHNGSNYLSKKVTVN